MNKKEKIKQIRKLIFRIADGYDRNSPKGQKIVEFIDFITRKDAYELDRWQEKNRSRYRNRFEIVKDNIVFMLYNFHQALKTQPHAVTEEEHHEYKNHVKRLEYAIKRINKLLEIGIENTIIVGDEAKGFSLREKRI